MSEKEKILRYYRSSGDGEMAARLLDSAESALKSRRYRVSDFIDPFGAGVAETISAHYGQLVVTLDGGYTGAERVKAAFAHQDFLGKPEFDLAGLSIVWDTRFYQLTHRDVLGALMGLGIKRDVLGDIIMTGNGCQVVLDTSFVPFIAQNLLKVGNAPVIVQTVDLAAIAPHEEKMKEIRTTVASLRLDVVAAAGFGLSRTKMASEISAEKIKVNWQTGKNSAQTVKAGDVISMRGRGRVEICEIIGQTKKGRTSILLKRFM
ncbi:Hypothetical protein LUCI_1400 [Lucifera butyrica]|uniref:RNA-binding S4 domain-containing protein n=1 Tax=Lucifera butyrica TaxID=1351585 RepID=A0A498R441_9FIRM|nr:YlmH/Sll1252 family protein [Lucifera butyrica]VBB06184.1 Hypothetical protein LUCI_1400 [Lucifera butyrica]